MIHFWDSVRPAISPLRVRDTEVQPVMVIALLCYSYILLIYSFSALPFTSPIW